MWKWRNEIRVILSILTGVFIGVGLNRMEEMPEMGRSFIALGAASFIILVILLLKGRKKYGVEELASDIATMSADLADFAGERRREDPVNRVKMPKRNWDDNRKNEESQERMRESIEYSSATMAIYRRRFAGKVIHLVEEAKKLGYKDKEIDLVYQHPTNRLGIERLSDRMGALSLRMRKEK